MKFPKAIKNIKPAVVAIGFFPNSNQVNILGSGFFIGDSGKLFTVAHLLQQTPEPFRDKLMAMVLTKQEENGLNHYSWIPIDHEKDDFNNDVAVFQARNYEGALYFKSKALELGDSDKIDLGEDAYFIGFPYAAQLMNDGFGITLIVNKAMVSNIKQDGTHPSHPRNFIILDAISNPGNSGCPLVDMQTNKVIGIMSISFRMKSQVNKELDIREPMHICAARPINLAKKLLGE